jgi:histidinol dehydrogenase
VIEILREGEPGFDERLAAIEGRAEAEGTGPETAVRRILADVRRRGDAALAELTKRFDGVDVASRLEIPQAELRAAKRALPREARRALELAAERIRDYHERQVQPGWSYREAGGFRLGQKVDPLERVGVYVPGGRASYPSSVLMNVIPAKVAGVGEVIAVSPPAPAEGSYAAVLAAAAIAGVTRFFRVGGAQAVAALAYGTESIPRVDKIVGPGNVYVQTAKRLVFGRVGIDNFAGASEVLVVADRSANPRWVAADLLSQAEHDEMASAVCVTDSAPFARALAVAIGEQLERLPRREIAAESVRRYGAIFVVRGRRRMIELANRIAPEHLELAVEDPNEWLPKIRHAGAIFLGSFAPEPFGDYLAGPNHVLPTGGTARFGSPLGVYDFVKRTSLIEGSPKAVRELGPAVVTLARLEGLEAHARAIEVRVAEKGTVPGEKGTVPFSGTTTKRRRKRG